MSYLTRTNLRRLDPTVYEEAAERIQAKRNTYSCFAVNAAALDCHRIVSIHDDAYQEAFKPRTAAEERHHPYWNKEDRWKSCERRNNRVMALLTMAAMVRSAKA